MKNILLFTGLFAVLAAAAVIFAFKAPEAPASGKVLASSYPVYFFAREISGGKLDIENLTPQNASIHTYELSAPQLSDIEKSRLLLLLGTEPWAERAERAAGDPARASRIGTPENPHAWLSPQSAKSLVGGILQALSRIDPGNKYTFELNANALINNLDQLDIAYKEGLANCKRRDFISAHPAFGALSQSYGLMQIPMSPAGDTPSMSDITKMVNVVKNSPIHYVFYSDETGKRFAQTISEESGAQVLLLDAIEGISTEEIADGKSYLTKMRDNLLNLRQALECR